MASNQDLQFTFPPPKHIRRQTYADLIQLQQVEIKSLRSMLAIKLIAQKLGLHEEDEQWVEPPSQQSIQSLLGVSISEHRQNFMEQGWNEKDTNKETVGWEFAIRSTYQGHNQQRLQARLCHLQEAGIVTHLGQVGNLPAMHALGPVNHQRKKEVEPPVNPNTSESDVINARPASGASAYLSSASSFSGIHHPVVRVANPVMQFTRIQAHQLRWA